MNRLKVRVGDVIPVDVTREIIDGSTPCNKDECMLHNGFMELCKTHELPVQRCKATNHGLQFDVYGRRILTVFDTKTSERIYGYDETFTRTRSKEKARASVRPFKARLMVESSTAVPPKGPPMSEEQKKALADWRKKNPRADKKRAGKGVRRKISM